ncbi:hypothetical protein D5H78_09155 [Vallicoccus soli]|uniref:Glycosyl-hydrolase family 116 catalytic region domain-containing protein n=2 Tax=Vallicoccus soli TaxID=2339232 RepID=A0A3A3Z749_9ACTN|nr:hypothetical protein D5H78_09155 [Vallicoccus soli]
MPVGGACAGQVYLSGDGRLWLWDVFNPAGSPYGGADWQGVHYAQPLTVSSPFRTGFAVRWGHGAGTTTRTLDDEGFRDVRFRARYPVGTTTFRDADAPLEVRLDAFSPFVPTEVEDSSLPATVLEYTVRNTSGRRLRVELAGLAENPVGLQSRTRQPLLLRSEPQDLPVGRAVVHRAAEDTPSGRPDIVVEDWEREGWGGWTVEGTAFGDGPVRLDQVPGYMTREGSLGVTGSRFVTSHHFRAGGGIPEADAHRGRLTSPPFAVERSALLVRVGGGPHPGRTCVEVLVDGEVVASATGAASEVMRLQRLDLSAYEGRTAVVRVVDDAEGDWAHVNVDRIVLTDRPPARPDVVFEEWDGAGFGAWTVSGTAFGAGPVTEAETPDYFRRSGPLGVSGRFVTSHHWRAGGDAAAADAETGRLTSPDFVVERRYVAVRIGGGAGAGTRVDVVVDGAVVATARGRDAETLLATGLDVGAHEGATARLEVVDEATGGWGHVNVDRIWFTDEPVDPRPLEELPDVGSFALAALHPAARCTASLAEWDDPAGWFDGAAGPTEARGARARPAGAVVVPLDLAPGASATVRFALAWHFPVVARSMFSALEGAAGLRRHYGEAYEDAAAVARHLATEGGRLSAATHLFSRTWYDDSTFPHWFLERTLINASTLATGTCYRFQDGRFYAWEGIYCCEGTCTHVWNYAQSVARLFPGLERDTRERVDLGIAFHEDTGAIDYRGEFARHVAHDGQCGNVLRTYREHQMAPDDAFLRRVWPRVRKATEHLVAHDGEPDGILEREQYNTLDATWYGEIPWISGLYVAALRAAAEMADDVGDRAFATRCRDLADRGSRHLDAALWNARYGYYEQHLDPEHADAINANRGCHLDQLFGQSYAWQLGLPRVFDAAKTRTALASLYRYNFLPDASGYAEVSGIPGGRVFSEQGEAGTLLCTWPYGGAELAPGGGEPFAVGYFNEVWTGLEHQFAAHLMAEGMVDEALAVERAVHDRHSAQERNPYNEVECSDHYARAMMSHAVHLSALGYEHHGPRGHLGFAPRLRPHDAAAAFTTAEGWGRYAQRRTGARQVSEVELRHGRLRLRTLATELEDRPGRGRLVVDVDLVDQDGRARRLRPRSAVLTGRRLLVTLDDEVVLRAGQTLRVVSR